MWTVSGVKEEGKRAFKANYGNCLVVSLILGAVSGGFSGASINSISDKEEITELFSDFDPKVAFAIIATVIAGLTFLFVLGILFKIFIANPIKVGAYAFFKKNITDPPAQFGVLGEGFKNYGHNFVTLFLTDLYNSLWLMLFIIPGIVKAYSYSMVPYIITDHPELSSNEVITMSRKMMQGNKWRAFCLDLSFLGWIILGILTCGLVLVFWTSPYMESTTAALYNELKNEYSEIG